MRLKIGLEKEFFCLDAEGNPCVVPAGMAADSCGWLVEARGEAFFDITDAVYSLKADEYKLQKLAAVKGVTLDDVPVKKVSRTVRTSAARSYDKGLIKYRNLYGYENHKNTLAEAVAGVHLSFTNPGTVSLGDGKADRTYYKNFDWVQIFLALDKAFAVEIKAAKRNPGFYEIKSDGRIEYRSLPSNVDLDKVIDVLTTLLK